MSIWDAVILGLVQGISEFLPISSSAHLSILNNLFNISNLGQNHSFFELLLHLGCLIALCIVFWQDFADMFQEAFGMANLGPRAGLRQSQYPAARQLVMLLLATLPLLLIIPISSMIKTLYYNSIFVGIMLVLTGGLLFVADKMQAGKKTGRSMSILDALIIGICQCVAVVPGLSRTGTVISAGIATGLNREYAFKFTFLLSVPAMLGSIISDIGAISSSRILWSDVPAYLVGTAVAIIAGIGALSLMKLLARKAKFGGFAYYCWLVGVLSIILTMIF